MITVYHEIQRKRLAQVLREGLVRTAGSDKDTDEITRTNHFINQYRTAEHLTAGLDRSHVLYCYLTEGRKVRDITDGRLISPGSLATDKDHVLLQVKINKQYCWVSNLDTFDQIKKLLKRDNIAEAARMAGEYWQEVCLYPHYVSGSMRRPELMVTHNISPRQIELFTSSNRKSEL